MCRFWEGGISSFPFSRAREYRLLRRLLTAKKLQQILELYQLTQLINDPTRITESTQSLQLGVCITSSPEKVTFSGIVYISVLVTTALFT
jgi:hypothetical protein